MKLYIEINNDEIVDLLLSIKKKLRSTFIILLLDYFNKHKNTKFQDFTEFINSFIITQSQKIITQPQNNQNKVTEQPQNQEITQSQNNQNKTTEQPQNQEIKKLKIDEIKKRAREKAEKEKTTSTSAEEYIVDYPKDAFAHL